MLLRLKSVLTGEEVARARAMLGNDAAWMDGAATAGAQAHAVKHNQQIPADSETSRALQPLLLGALQRDPVFLSAALPKRIFPPRFNRYRGPGEHYGAHIDNAILRSGQRQGDADWLRADLSCTVFLSDPSEHDGGELVVHDRLGAQAFKLDPGDALLYPSGLLHEVRPVTRGQRIASFFWIESLVAGEDRRRALFDLDMNLLSLRARHGESDETVALTGVYHNLLRMWATP